MKWKLLWQIPVILGVLIILYTKIFYLALEYVGARDCIKYGGYAYVIYPKYFCTRIEDGTTLMVDPRILKELNLDQPDPMRNY